MKRTCGATMAAWGAAAFFVFMPSAHAAPLVQTREPTDGVDRVVHDVAGKGDASSIEQNPALLGSVHGVDLTVRGYQRQADGVRGQGFAGFFALRPGLPFALGFGVQVVRPRLGGNLADFASAWQPSITKLSWAFAVPFGKAHDSGALGVSLSGVRANGRWLQAPDLDVGGVARLYQYASLGVNARLSPASVRADALPTTFVLTSELALRPLGTQALEVAGSLRAVLLGFPGADRKRVGLPGLLPRGRIALRHQGWALTGEVEQIRVTELDPTLGVPVREAKALRGGVGIEASWDTITAGLGIHAGVAENGIDGIGYLARFHSQLRGRVFWPRQIDIERVKLSDIDDERNLIEVLAHLRRAEAAGRRAILLVHADRTGAGWASLHEVRVALQRVRDAGGHVFAYLEGGSMKEYYVASVAQDVFVHPAAQLSIFGLSGTWLYFKDTLDMLGVRAEVIRINEWKSAYERLTAREPSAADRMQREELQRDLFTQITRDIAASRKLTVHEVRARIDDAPYDPDRAIADGLADDVAYRDELEDKIGERIQADVRFRDFRDTSPHDRTWTRAPYLGVVLVEGTILDGKSRTIPFFNLHFAGGDTLAKSLQQLREDPACKGIVLRINSPGGSAFASDIIWREVDRTQQAHVKNPRTSPPIVVSMGDVAASGGYYVAAPASVIFADPMTITGSIGVISLHIDASGLLRKLGVSATTMKQGKNADIGTPFSPYTDDQRERVQASIAQTYDRFRTVVAQGRNLSMERVDELGRGRVFSGTDARAVGLVDRFGGLNDALAHLEREIAWPKHRGALDLRVVPRNPTLLDLILEAFGEPFGRRGALGRINDKRREKAASPGVLAALPPTLRRALARLPLSILFLPHGQAHTLMDSLWQVDGTSETTGPR